MSYISAGVREPVRSLDHLRSQVNALFAHVKPLVIDLAKTRVQVKVPAGDAGLVDFVIQSDDFLKTTITTLNADVFPKLLFHLIDRACYEKASHRYGVRPGWIVLFLVANR